MALEMTFLGHSGFVFSDQTQAVAVDPFLTGNPLAVQQPQDIQCQTIALTHGHADHLGDTIAIAKANDATVIAAFELANYLNEQGIAKTQPINLGGQVKTPFGSVAMTHAFHSSSYEGRYMGMPGGLILRIGGVTIYHCGDTGLFGDMKLIGKIYQPDIACIPVGDQFTMGPRLGAMAAEMIGAKIAIPIHYKTFPALTSDIGEFTPRHAKVKILEPGESWTFQ